MSDLISRQAAIDAVRKCNVKEVTPSYMLIDKAEAMTELMMLPSAQPERKKGRWIGKPLAGFTTVKCSCCGDAFCENEGLWNYCPNCGADMRGGAADE